MPVADKLPVLTGFHTDMDRYTATPVWAVFKYLECFHDDGEQALPGAETRPASIGKVLHRI